MNDGSDGVRFGRMAPGVAVTDIHRAHDFYTRVFGFKKVFENGTPVGFMVLKRDDADLLLSQQKDFKANKTPGFNVAHLMVSDVDAVYAECLKQGVRIIKGLRDKDYGQRAFVFEDPDGNRIDVGEPVAQKER